MIQYRERAKNECWNNVQYVTESKNLKAQLSHYFFIKFQKSTPTYQKKIFNPTTIMF